MGVYRYPPGFEDDRTKAERKTHTRAVIATDSFFCNCPTGWRAENAPSYAGWAFENGDYYRCLSMVEDRLDMTRVRVVTLDGYRPNAAHTHIYVYGGRHKLLPTSR
jgi:hypothetical protein